MGLNFAVAGDEEMHGEGAAATPTKVISSPTTLRVQCQVAYVDLEGQVDGKSIKNTLAQVERFWGTAGAEPPDGLLTPKLLGVLRDKRRAFRLESSHPDAAFAFPAFAFAGAGEAAAAAGGADGAGAGAGAEAAAGSEAAAEPDDDAAAFGFEVAYASAASSSSAAACFAFFSFFGAADLPEPDLESAKSESSDAAPAKSSSSSDASITLVALRFGGILSVFDGRGFSSQRAARSWSAV